MVSIIISNYSLKITSHTHQSDKISSPLRIALISDSHSRSFGKDNRRLFDKIRSQDPDLIFVAGDILSRDHTQKEDINYLKNLIESLKDIAPTYFSIGNHERFNPTLEQIKTTVRKSGGILLDGEFTDINAKGNKLRIGGISYYRSWDEKSNEFLKRFCDTEEDVFTLLMCHNPEFYLWGIKDYPIDLTLSGHTHGGMVKIPFVGPLYSPEQGWFPDYAAGFYEFENGHLAVTTGLGSSPEKLPRILNRPEIMIIDLK